MPRSSAERFERFARLVGLRVEPFQRRIVRAWLGEQREVVTVVPRGAGKSKLAACFGLWHLLTHPDPAVYVGAASRDQARVVFEYARAMARAHPAVARAVKVRHLELRAANGQMRVLASDGNLAHGLTPTLMLADELWAWKGADLLDAFQTALVKRPDARLLVISTAAATLDSPLGRLRARALAAPAVKRRGVVTEAAGPDVRLLEWSLTPDEVQDDALVARVNPARWIDAGAIRRQRAALHPAVFAQFHACVWGSGESAWLPAGAWQACATGDTTLEPGAEIVVGIDAGKNLSDTAVVWIDAKLRVNCEVFEGERAITELDPLIDELARTYRVREVTADPWHVTGVLTAAWEARGLTVSEWPQTDSRLIPASKTLYEAIAERRLVHPNHPKLNEHVAGTILRSTRRGARIDKAPGRNNDAVVALIAAHDRVTAPPIEPPRLLGFL